MATYCLLPTLSDLALDTTMISDEIMSQLDYQSVGALEVCDLSLETQAAEDSTDQDDKATKFDHQGSLDIVNVEVDAMLGIVGSDRIEKKRGRLLKNRKSAAESRERARTKMANMELELKKNKETIASLMKIITDNKLTHLLSQSTSKQ